MNHNNGRPIRETQELERIKFLDIPPAWTRIWICPLPNGHLQATGYDVKGRKQYRYHPRWREVRDETKYGWMLALGEVLPIIHKQVEHDLRLPDLPRAKVLATVIRLLETTRIRGGNEEYARTNRSFGLTTLCDRHVAIAGATLRFHFRGKSGKNHTVKINDRRLARIVKACQEIPGSTTRQRSVEGIRASCGYQSVCGGIAAPNIAAIRQSRYPGGDPGALGGGMEGMGVPPAGLSTEDARSRSSHLPHLKAKGWVRLWLQAITSETVRPIPLRRSRSRRAPPPGKSGSFP